MTDIRSTPWAGRYAVGLFDPAWKYRTWSSRGLTRKTADAHYRTESTSEMGKIAVSEVMAPDAWLALWTTWPMLAAGEHAHLMEEWGDPANPWVGVTGGAWAKRPRGWRGDPDKWGFGTGHILRSSSEPLLLYRRGRPQPWASKSERGLWVAPIREHSRKPDEVKEMLDRALPEGPRIEGFSRQEDDGWDHWGDEAGKFTKAKKHG